MQIGVVGVGKMGSALARRFLEQGADVVVWNRSTGATDELVAQGAARAGSLADVWRGAEAVFSFLADDAALETVVLGDAGLLAHAPTGGVLVEMSTVSPAISATVAASARAAGIEYLCCPVSGNPAVLAAGNLTLIVSGKEEIFEQVLPLLERVGPKVIYVGVADEARTMKLAVNAMLAATAEALAESIVLCEGSGIDRATALDVISSSAIGSPFVAYKREALIERRYDATFTMAMLAKDLHLVGDAAARAGVALPLAALVAELADASTADGLGDLDFLALLVHVQRLAGQRGDV